MYMIRRTTLRFRTFKPTIKVEGCRQKVLKVSQYFLLHLFWSLAKETEVCYYKNLLSECGAWADFRKGRLVDKVSINL